MIPALPWVKSPRTIPQTKPDLRATLSQEKQTEAEGCEILSFVGET